MLELKEHCGMEDLVFELDVFYRLREDILAIPTEGVPFNFGASLPRTNLNTRDNRGF